MRSELFAMLAFVEQLAGVATSEEAPEDTPEQAVLTLDYFIKKARVLNGGEKK